MTIDNMSRADLVDALREANQPEAFNRTVDRAISEAEEGTLGERLARKHVAERMAEGDKGFDAEDFGADVVNSDSAQLATAIGLLRKQVNAATRNPSKHEILTARLNRLVTRKATVAVASRMQKQEDERQVAVGDQLFDLEDISDA